MRRQPTILPTQIAGSEFSLQPPVTLNDHFTHSDIVNQHFVQSNGSQRALYYVCNSACCHNILRSDGCTGRSGAGHR